jgi:glyceraldehyde-3-phosphate dehydrogenase/erythrose-4-phosphate dehydrogenase
VFKKLTRDGGFEVLAWYDNEWGYAARLADRCAHIARRER